MIILKLVMVYFWLLYIWYY